MKSKKDTTTRSISSAEPTVKKISQVRARSDKQLKTKSQGDKRNKSTRRRVNQQQHLDKNNFST
jgi:hypothetical protein